MKKLLVLSFCFINVILYAQEETQTSKSAKWKIGILGGANFADASGLSTVFEYKTNYLLKNLYTKISIGYSNVTNDEYIEAKGYNERADMQRYYYVTYSYDINSSNYNTIPISLGAEYYLTQGDISPYGIFEMGVNAYWKNSRKTSNYMTRDTYADFEEIPDEYRNPRFGEKSSFRLAFGAGSNINLFSNFNLDVRYIFQVSRTIGNYHQLLAGIVI